MFGRAQRTSLPSFPSQNVPIDFNQAASSKDAAHVRAKLDHDRSKLSLTSLSPGQEVYLQISKSSAWDKRGIIVSMRPDRLSYVIRVDNRFFARPRRLLRPIFSDTPSPDTSVTPPLLHLLYSAVLYAFNPVQHPLKCSRIFPLH